MDLSALKIFRYDAMTAVGVKDGEPTFVQTAFLGEKDSLETEEFNKLGTAASMGCVRLPVEDAKWIFDNCPSGTTVHIYDSEELPVERPTVQTLDPDDPRSGWDPTDPDENNPWNQ